MPQRTPPRHLSAPSRRWLAHLSTDYTFTETEWSLALMAAETRDRASTARRTMTREGLTLTTPILSKKGDIVGQRVSAHPAAAIARDNVALYSRLVSQLGLDDDAEGGA
ncbi:hypothetical protein FSW04_17925 [Baekduia soli]|uniref:Uncharacterized protein n=1 Tax=Baekduia soli TaxID=496014 RepID=A0A5B8U8M0_9ACTN|nr:hypothetical protein [Baekduia soli]QEC49271.1 hypothetical protein FSW04_17925 [Baekduia soli]